MAATPTLLDAKGWVESIADDHVVFAVRHGDTLRLAVDPTCHPELRPTLAEGRCLEIMYEPTGGDFDGELVVVS